MKCACLIVDHNAGMTSTVAGLFDDNLSVDPVFELADMGDDTDQTLSSSGEVLHGIHGLIQGILIQGAEALIHKHGLQADASRM